MARTLIPSPAGETRSVGILLLPDFSNLTLAALTEPLRVANRAAGRPLYQHRLLTEDGAPVSSSSGLRISSGQSIAGLDRFELLFVVASFNVKRHLKPTLLTWLRQVAARAELVGGMESGAYLLAHAGLLDGHKATTHWEDLEDFATGFPEVEVVNERFVVDGTRVTASGAIPTLDFILNMVRQHHGLRLALDVGGSFIYEQDSAAADPQHVLSLGALRWMEPKLSAAVDLMERHLDEPLSLPEIARRTGLGERGLQRLFRRRLGQTPQSVYLSIRLNAARRLLAQTELPIAEVADACGFGSRITFHRAFRKAFERPPSAFRQDDFRPGA